MQGAPGLAVLALLSVAACRSAAPSPADPLRAGAAAYERGDWDTALAHYREALRASPDDPQLLDLEGETLLELGRFAEALDALDRSLALDSGNPYTHAHRGQVLLALGRRDEALAAFERAVELAPDLEPFQAYLDRARAITR